MSHIPFSLVIVSAFSIAAQTINLTGKVTSASSAAPLGNVVVTLKNTPGITSTTGTDGTYHLQGSVSVDYNLAGAKSFSGSRLNNGVLEVGVAKREQVTVETFSLSGALKDRLVNELKTPGLYKFDICKSSTAADLLIVKVCQGDKTTTYPLLSMNSAFSKAVSIVAQSRWLAKATVFSDTILFSLSGFTTGKRGIASATGANNDFILQPQLPTVTDVDGNVYDAITIGTQVWMVENLKTTKYNDGTAIPTVTGGTAWWSTSTPAYCWYNNDQTNKNTYGAIYN